MMAKTKAKLKRKPNPDAEFVTLMVPREFRRQVNIVAEHTGENAPEVVKRVASSVMFAEFRKVLSEG